MNRPVRSLRDRRQFLGTQFGGCHDVAGAQLVDTWQMRAHAVHIALDLGIDREEISGQAGEEMTLYEN